MTKLSDIQRILLSTAASRLDGNLLPPPVAIVGQAGRIAKAIPPLLERELVAEVDAAEAEKAWREEDDRKIGLAITAAGRHAVECEEPTPPPADTASTAAPPAPARITKSATVLDLLQRPDGATLAELVEATGWLPHTTRAALTGLRKKGHAVLKGKRGETTCYSIVATA